MRFPFSRIAIAFASASLSCLTASADESDQYMTWDRELADSSPAINAFINQKVREGIQAENDSPGPPCDCETLALRIIPEIYLDRLRANLIDFVENSHAIDAHPTQDVSNSDIFPLSIYRRAPVQFVIRVTRTIRIGDVYFSVDKLNHLVGIGRRYFVRYLADRRDGMTETEAELEVIRWGIFTENSILGKHINGIFSCADLEANYQGLRFARRFCEGDDRFLRYDGQKWMLAREVDLREFVTPAFDESFYPSLYSDEIRMPVLTILAEDYAARTQSPILAERFKRYRRVPPGTSMRFVERYLIDNGVTPQFNGLLDVLRIQPGHPATPLNAFNLDGSSEALGSP